MGYLYDQLEMVPAPRWTCPSDRPRAETCHCPGNQRPRKPGSWWHAWLSNGSPMNQVRKLRKSHDFTILVEKIPGRTGETWWNHMKCQWRIAMAQNPIETATKLETYQFQTQNMSVHYIVHYSDCRWLLQGWPLAKFSLMRPLPSCVVLPKSLAPRFTHMSHFQKIPIFPWWKHLNSPCLLVHYIPTR